MADYKYPEVSASADWVASHGDEPKVRLVEVDVEASSYENHHIKKAEWWKWTTQFNNNVRRNIPNQNECEALCSSSGIASDHTATLYGDNNWFATFAFWRFKIYDHEDVGLMNESPKKRELEAELLTTEAFQITPTHHRASSPDASIRTRGDEIFQILDKKRKAHLVHVRSPVGLAGSGAGADPSLTRQKPFDGFLLLHVSLAGDAGSGFDSEACEGLAGREPCRCLSPGTAFSLAARFRNGSGGSLRTGRYPP
jgi:3-mercaptopyruvate sulfurtransferase SseA